MGWIKKKKNISKGYWGIIFLLIISSCSFTDKVCFEDSCVTVKIADSPSERKTGLMFINKLPANEGMLFIFDSEDIRKFWMKNTYVPLDMIWINKDNFVVDITKNAEPCSEDPCPVYSSKSSAKYVLEVNSGYSDKNNLKIGDKVEFLI